MEQRRAPLCRPPNQNAATYCRPQASNGETVILANLFKLMQHV